MWWGCQAWSWLQMVAMIGYAPAMIRRTLIRARLFAGCLHARVRRAARRRRNRASTAFAPGMTRDEVRAKLGEPSVRIPPRVG